MVRFPKKPGLPGKQISLRSGESAFFGGPDVGQGGLADSIYAGSHMDSIYAGSRMDSIYAGSQMDSIYAGSQMDSIYAGSAGDLLGGGTVTKLIYDPSRRSMVSVTYNRDADLYLDTKMQRWIEAPPWISSQFK